jgi:class 3 adenylate cyclase
VLPNLTAEDLDALKITSVGHRRRTLSAVATLKAGLARASENTSAERSTPQPSASPSPIEAERRHLTVMFIDLVDSTALSEKLDPEDMREIIRSYQNTVAGELMRFEGHIAKFMGDGVLAYFG